MPTSTVENYVKQLYLEQQRSPGTLVPLGKLANSLGVVPGTVTTMIRTLADAELVHYEPRTGVSLTEAGDKLALHVLRRHRLVELFLVRVVGLDWSEVHDEAEELEHVISDKVLERIDIILGHPTVDPHGDPIPDATGQVAKLETQALSSCNPSDAVRIERINNQDGQFLRVITELGLVPGTTHRVLKNDALAGTLTLSTADGVKRVIGTRAADFILVRPAEPAAVK